MSEKVVKKRKVKWGKAITLVHSFVLFLAFTSLGQISSYPYQEGFETDFGNWVNISGDDFNWTRQTGGTPSNGTGPNAAAENSYYLYTEVNGNNNKSAILTALFDFTGQTGANISFQYHMLGNSVGSLFLEAYSAGSWTALTSFSGQQQTNQTTWGSTSVDLASLVGDTVTLRFRVQTASGSKGDIAIDDIQVTVPCTTIGGNAAISENVICSNQSVDLSLTNYTGGSSIQWQMGTDGINYSNIAAGTTAAYTTNTLGIGNNYYFRAMVTNGCNNYSDTAYLSTQSGVGNVSSFPHLEDFESGLVSWSNSTSDDFNWTVGSGGTPSNQTGPDGASEQNQYIFTEANNPNNPTKMAWLENGFDLSTGDGAILEFYYHMFGNQMGTLEVEVNGSSVWSVTGQQHASNATSYSKATIDLTSFSGCNTSVIIKAETGSGQKSDIAIDSIGVYFNSTTWTGNTDADWHISGNWSQGIPVCGQSVIIPASASNMPVISAAATCGSMDLQSGASLTISGSNTLTVCGNWNGQGIFTANQSTVVFFNKSSAKTINLSGQTTFHNLTNNESSGLSISSGSIALTGTLAINNGDFVTNNSLTLVSNASGTARFAALGSGASISGDVTVQRYIAETDGWVNLGTSVQNTTLNDIDDDIITSGFTGSDYPLFGFNNVYTFVETTLGTVDLGWIGASNISNTFHPQNGTFIYFGAATTFTIDVTNQLYTGPFDFNITHTIDATRPADEEGWNLISNPYASAIDWNSGSWTKINLNDAMYIWNSTDQQYATYVGGVGTNGGTSTIASSQAFWVQANASSPSLVADEGVKTASAAVFRSGGSDHQLVRIILEGSSLSDETVLHLEDGTQNYFEGSSDAIKQFSLDSNVPNIYSYVDGLDYAINTFAPPAIETKIPIVTQVGSTGTYSLHFPEISLEGFDIELEDIFSGETYSLSEDTTIIGFQLSDTTSIPRFNLILIPQTNPALPIELIDFRVDNQEESVLVSWKTATETNNDYFTVERKSEEGNWEALQMIEGAGTSHSPLSYIWMDENPLPKDSYYRLKQTDFDGQFSYSQLEIVQRGNQSAIQVFPNPFKEILNVEWPEGERPQIQITDSRGVEIMGKAPVLTGIGSQQFNLKQLSPGVYFIVLNWPEQSKTFKVVKK